jgi:hypothetical protein
MPVKVIAIEKGNGAQWALLGVAGKVFKEITKSNPKVGRPIYYNEEDRTQVHPAPSADWTIKIEIA